jgi:tRNA threonylcarbamoyladenosine biosynthesis protein TsaE
MMPEPIPEEVDSPGARWSFVAHHECDTDRLGEALAGELAPGVVVALVGNLGAGKTRFVRAVALALGVDRQEINSPTFVLIHEYEGRIPVYHFDAYRLHDVRGFIDLGALDYFGSDGVCLVEWADRVASTLPVDHLRIEITTRGATEREFRFRGGGPVSARIVEALARGNLDSPNLDSPQ